MICLTDSSCSTWLRGRKRRVLLATSMMAWAEAGSNELARCCVMELAGTTRTFSSMSVQIKRSGVDISRAEAVGTGEVFPDCSQVVRKERIIDWEPRTESLFRVEHTRFCLGPMHRF